MTAEPIRTGTQVGTKRLGEILVERNLVTPEQLDLALSTAVEQQKKLGQVLVEQGVISSVTLATTLSAQLGVPIVDLKRYQISQEAVRLVPEEVARRYRLLPLAIESGTILVATSEPQGVAALEDVRARVRMGVKPLLALESDIEEAINHQYRATGEIERQISQISSTVSTLAPERVSAELVTGSPVV